MKKFIIPLIILIIAIPFLISYFLQNPQIDIENNESHNKEVNIKKEDEVKRNDSEKGFKLHDIEERYKKLKPPPYQERLRIAAEIKKKNALELKKNLEWLQEDIEIDYINQEEKMVEPFETIKEEDVGWDVQSLDVIDRYNIEDIKNYIPVQFKVEQMAKGGFKNKIKSLEAFSPSGRKQIFYSKEYQIEVEPSDKGIDIFYFGSDGAYGAFALYGGTERGFSGYIDHVDLGGRHLIELNKDGKGYVYNIYN